jgi:hypothetical protein
MRFTVSFFHKDVERHGFFCRLKNNFLFLPVFCGEESTIFDFYGETTYAQK